MYCLCVVNLMTEEFLGFQVKLWGLGLGGLFWELSFLFGTEIIQFVDSLNLKGKILSATEYFLEYDHSEQVAFCLRR